MPQFDSISFLVQVLTLWVFIYLYYYVLVRDVMVKTAKALKMRNKILKINIKKIKVKGMPLRDFILLIFINKIK